MEKSISQFANQAAAEAADLFLIERDGEYFNVTGADILSGAVVEDTAANVFALVGADDIAKSTLYYITDAYTWIRGVDVDKVSSDGLFLARNAAYQGVGDYSGITIANGFTVNTTSVQLGVWHAGLAPAAGDIAIYNNLNWLNLLGAVGTAPDGDAVNWEPVTNQINLGPNLDETLAEIKTFGYIFEVDPVKYDLVDNKVISRSDRRGNIVRFDTENSLQNPIDVFQWGNDNVYGNKVEANSIFTCHNNRQDIQYNTIRNCTITAAMATNDFNNNVLNNINGGTIYSLSAVDIVNQISEDSPPVVIAAFGANQNDFALPEGQNFEMGSAGVARNLTGMTGGRNGRRISIHNTSGINLVVTHDDVGSVAANRFNVDNTGAASLTLTDGQSADFIYSTTNSRWNLVTLYW